VTSRCARSLAGRYRISAATTARSAQSSRGLGLVRRSTATSCRRTSPKLRPIRQAISGLSWSFIGFGRVAFWLLQGERDRGAEELEGLPLDAGRLGEHRDGDVGAGVPDLVAGQGSMRVMAVLIAASIRPRSASTRDR
jgi:hypothetical protein